MSSFAVDFRARQAVESNMSHFIVRQLPVGLDAQEELPWATGLGDFVRPRVAELTYTAWDLQGWASDIGYAGPPYRWEPQRRELLQAELDAALFHHYALDRAAVEAVLDSFESLAGKESRPTARGGHGEFRTKRLILERYDDMAKAADTVAPYESPLEPPPADDAIRHLT